MTDEIKDFQNVCLNVLQRQYLYTNIAKLTQLEAQVWDGYLGNLTENFCNDILNFNTCVSSALDNFWGKIFKISRVFKNEETNEIYNLTDDEFREIIKLRAFGTTWNGSLGQLNTFLYQLFKNRGIAYCIDNLNMTSLIYSFNFQLEDWEKYLFEQKNILPRNAGVGTEIEIYDTDKKYFGYRVYGQINILPTNVGYRLYGNQYPTGKGAYRQYGDE